MSFRDSVSLKILQDTFFKASPVDSSRLGDLQKAKVAAARTLEVRRYRAVDGHIQVELDSAIAPVGQFGYFYEKHVQLVETSPIFIFGQDNPSAVPPGCSLLAIARDTLLKLQPEDSSQLDAYEQISVSAGQTFFLLGYASVEGHFRVTFLNPIPNFGKIGYLYAPDVQILKDGIEDVPFNPNAINLTVLKTTAFKKRPVAAATLPPDEKTTLPIGMIYGVAGYLFESGHLKVTFTENLPNFGNTGYLYPNFVQLSRGSTSFTYLPVIDFIGPSEFLAKQPITLNGTFDPQKVAKVTAIAEDNYPLTVTLNPPLSRWQVRLDRGFQEAGARWLRLEAANSNGEVIASQIANITVTEDALSVGRSLSLKVTSDTFFKSIPVDSTTLEAQQKIIIQAGQTFSIRKYGLVDGHLKVTLNTSVPPVGNFGYFYEGDVQLRKGEKVLKFDAENVVTNPIIAQMVLEKTTLLKAKPVDSSDLADNEKITLVGGKSYSISGYASFKGHFQVTLTEAIPGFGNVGYVYWRDVQIIKDGKTLPYDPDALTVTIEQTTAFKDRPINASELSNTQKVTLQAGMVYGVAGYSLESGHLKVTLTEEFPGVGNTGYLFPSYLKMRRGGEIFDPLQNQGEMNVPYFSQRDNPRFYWSTCNVTSIAMVLYYYGIRPRWGGQLEDELLQWCFDRYGEGSQTEHSVLSELVRAYGLESSFSTTRTWAQVKNELANQRPVVIAGDMTASGHILCAIGYNSRGLIVNDPWGNALTGYVDTEGRKLLYPYDYLDRVAGPDGKIWAHFIRKE